MTDTSLAPLEGHARQQSIDLLRGIAVFGILLVNMESWALPGILRANPYALDYFSPSDLIVWYFIRGFAEYKFVGLFSLLFGAAIAMQVQRSREKGIHPEAFYYRRMLWLGFFGALHAILFWTGEILFTYAAWGLVALSIAKADERSQKRCMLIFFGVLVSGLVAISIGSRFFIPENILQKAMSDWTLSTHALKEKIDFARLDLHEQWLERAKRFVFTPVMLLFSTFSWKVGAMMVLGILLYKKGILSAERGADFYGRIAGLGLGAGAAVVFPGLCYGHHTAWAFQENAGVRDLWLQISSLPLILAYMALVMLVYKKKVLQGLQKRLQAVGRMSLTNYLLQTLIGTFIFYGYGLGLYNEIDRVGQLAITVAIWLVQLYFSDLWLRCFRFGPFEWLWRSLTYGQWQPMKLSS